MAATSSATLFSIPFPASPSRVFALGHHKHRPFRVSPVRCSNASPNLSSGAPAALPKPQIELEFVGPRQMPMGRTQWTGRQRRPAVRSSSGTSCSRTRSSCMPHMKVMNCGGAVVGGSCDICIVEIIDGKDLLNERTNIENRYLKKKLESWRLACQTIVGNKENSGKVVVQRLLQWKK